MSRPELEWFRQAFYDGEEFHDVTHDDIVHYLCDYTAILGTEDLPPQLVGTTFDVLAQKILDQAAAEKDAKERKRHEGGQVVGLAREREKEGRGQ